MQLLDIARNPAKNVRYITFFFPGKGDLLVLCLYILFNLEILRESRECVKDYLWLA